MKKYYKISFNPNTWSYLIIIINIFKFFFHYIFVKANFRLIFYFFWIYNLSILFFFVEMSQILVKKVMDGLMLA